MTNEKPEPSDKIKHEHVLEALKLLDFEEVMDLKIKPHRGSIKIAVDLSEGKKSVFFRDGSSVIMQDDEAGTLAQIGQVIINAEKGIMPIIPEQDGEIIAGNQSVSEDGREKSNEQQRPVPSHQQEQAKETQVTFNPPAEQTETAQAEDIINEAPKTTEPINHHINMKPAKLPEMPELTVDIVKKYINEKVTDEEAYAFIKVCTARNLNPFLRQVYIVKKDFTGTAKIIVGKDGFMEMAERNPMNDGFEAGIIVQLKDKTIEDRPGAFCLPDETILGGWAKVYRKDRDHCFENRVSMKEYNTGKASWAKIPATMIRKTPLVQSLREAYPAELSGMYDSSEMGVEVEK